MSLNERIKTARKIAGLTQQQLADAVDVSKSTIAGYELGNREPDSIKLYRIAKALNVSGDYLLELDINEHPREDISFSPEALAFAQDFDRLDEDHKRLARGFMALLKDHMH